MVAGSPGTATATVGGGYDPNLQAHLLALHGLTGLQPKAPQVSTTPPPAAMKTAINPSTYQSQVAKGLPSIQNPSQLIQSGTQGSSQLPQGLRIQDYSSVVSPQARQQYSNWYQQMYGAPAEGGLQAQISAQGQGNSTFAGAELGQLKAMDAMNSFGAGQQMEQNQFNQYLGARGSFFGGEGAMATGSNQLASSQGLGAGQLGLGYTNSGVNANTNLNQYNLAAYQAQQQAQQFNAQMQQQQIQNQLQYASQAMQYPSLAPYARMTFMNGLGI